MISFEFTYWPGVVFCATFALAHRDPLNRPTRLVHRHNVVPIQKFCPARNAALGQRLSEHPRIATFITGGVGAAHDVIGKRLECRLDFQQLIAADQLAINAVFAHQRGGVACRIEGFLIGVKVRDAALQPLVIDAGGAHHIFQRFMAVGAQGDDLLHVALKRGVVALRQKPQSPLPLLQALAHRKLGAKQERRIVAEHPLQRLQRRIAVGPRLAVAHRDLRRVGKAGFHRRVGLALHHGDLVPTLQQMPSRAHTNDACAQNDDFHGLECRGSRFALTAV